MGATLVVVLVAATTWPSPTEVRYLSGTGPDDAVQWDFFCTAGRRSREWTTIRVPSCWEQEGFGSYDYGGDVLAAGRPLAMEQGLYRHAFTVPAEWRDRVVRLVFEGSMTDTEAWVNGRSAGPVHQGGFYRFHYDVTDLLRFGESNLLEVTVAKVSANHSVNAAEREADYWVFGGIFRPVRLEALPRHFIDWTAIDAKFDGRFTAHVHLGARTPGAEVEARVVDDEDRPVGAPLVAAVSPDGEGASIAGRFDGVEAWTAEAPHLYRVRLTLRARRTGSAGDSPARRAETFHTTTERFGFRTIEVRPQDGVYLNRRRIRLKGVNRHCFWPETGRTVSREQSFADARLIKDANLNAVRMSHYPPDAHFLEAADELGLYVLDELAGWQASYDTPTARRLVGQVVRRDVNHPSILFWDNGNEGGWNTDVDGEFERWDPQGRVVLHPWADFGGIDTNHYEGWESHERLCRGPELYMPTEFLHGLYDGGIGAALHDYWDAMRSSATVAGGFLWALVDEGVARTDREGRVDNAGNRAPDGMVGPHREKEGSFFAVKQLWSPVQVTAPRSLARDWDGTLTVENAYDFTPLDRGRFEWRTVRFPAPDAGRSGHSVMAKGEVVGPAVAPGQTGRLKLPLPGDWREADALLLTARDAADRELWTWSWPVGDAGEARGTPVREWATATPAVSVRGEGAALVEVEVGELRLGIDATNGRLAVVRQGGRDVPLRGPRLVAFRREGRRFDDVAGESRLRDLATRSTSDGAVVTASYDGPLKRLVWTVLADSSVRLGYEYAFDGAVDLLGLDFDCPEARVRGKRWLGPGPHRVYRNRLEGGVLDVWEVGYNDPVPGETYASPEFKGYFRDWRWIALDTDEGDLTIENTSGVPFLGLYRPRMGVDGLLELPAIGLALLDVIPAQRTKFHSTDELGPRSARPTVGGVRRGQVVLRF